MRLPPFSLYQPSTVDEATRILAESPGSRLLAGGTDLLVNMKHRVERPEALVALSRVEGLAGVHREGGATVIGGMTTLKEIQTHPVLAEDFAALSQAAAAVGSYRHQTMGTLAGNLCQNTRCRFFNQSETWRHSRSLCYKAGGEYCHVMKKDDVCYSTYSGDVAPALLVLDASVRIQGPGGTREAPLAALYSGEGKAPLALEDTEIVTAVVLPGSSAGRSCYRKHSLRGSIDFPIVGSAVWRGDIVLRAAFTGVDRKPLRASALEAALDGRSLTEESIAEAAPLAPKGATVTRTTVQPVPFKRELMGRLFSQAARAVL